MNDEQAQSLMEALWRGREAREKAERELESLRAAFATLIDILAQKGVLAKGHTRFFEKVLKRSGPGDTVALRPDIDKYTIADVDIDCASLAHLCHLRCCSFNITLSEQDVQEGGIAWELREPYILKRRSDGYCTHLSRDGASGCTIYERRPATCRQYDCREDTRVWIDFANKIPAPMPDGLIPPSQLVRDSSTTSTT